MACSTPAGGSSLTTRGGGSGAATIRESSSPSRDRLRCSTVRPRPATRCCTRLPMPCARATTTDAAGRPSAGRSARDRGVATPTMRLHPPRAGRRATNGAARPAAGGSNADDERAGTMSARGAGVVCCIGRRSRRRAKLRFRPTRRKRRASDRRPVEKRPWLLADYPVNTTSRTPRSAPLAGPLLSPRRDRSSPLRSAWRCRGRLWR